MILSEVIGQEGKFVLIVTASILSELLLPGRTIAHVRKI